jgi:hypothetical protein
LLEARWFQKVEWKKPHPCKNRKDGPPNCKGKAQRQSSKTKLKDKAQRQSSKTKLKDKAQRQSSKAKLKGKKPNCKRQKRRQADC